MVISTILGCGRYGETILHGEGIMLRHLTFDRDTKRVRFLRPIAAAGLLALVTGPAAAGPCTADIDALQAKIDSRVDTTAGAGKLGSQSQAAQLHRQPTPQSIADAEAKLGEGKASDEALAALGKARKADAAGDAAACSDALAAARKALGS
jgi:hypothetical protein